MNLKGCENWKYSRSSLNFNQSTSSNSYSWTFLFRFAQLDSVVSSNATFDVAEDPLKCPLDLGHFADAGHGLKVLLDKNENNFSTKFSIKTKPVPGVDLFDLKPDISEHLKLKPFLTPFQRFQVRTKLLESGFLISARLLYWPFCLK